MSINIVNDVLKGYPDAGGAFSVMISLGENADDETGYVFCSIDYIAWRSKQGERNVQYCLKKLAQEGWIKRSEKTGPEGCNEYWLNTPRLRAAALECEKRFKEERAKKRAGRGLANPFISPETEVEEGGAKSAPPPAKIAPPPRKDCTVTPQTATPQPAIALHPNPLNPESTSTGSGSAAPSASSRRDEVRDAIQNHQRQRLGRTVWPPSADRALLALLKSYPDEAEWPASVLVRCVTNRFNSEAVDPAALPQAWLSELPTYASGEKNKFKQPTLVKQVQNGTVPGKDSFEDAILLATQGRATIPLAKTSSFCEAMRPKMPMNSHKSWIKPLVLGYVNEKNTVIIYAPSTEWVGCQDKWGENLSKALDVIGLPPSFEIHCLSRTGWKVAGSSKAA